IGDLYPAAAARAKTDADFRDRARKVTAQLQDHAPGYYLLWQRFRAVTQVALERDFHALGVDFDWWKGESDVDHLIAPMVAELDAKDLPADEFEDIAGKVAVAALKFADLSNFRGTSYVFDLDRFTSFEGRTGPYLLYQAVRVKSLLRRAGTEGAEPGPITVAEPAERD